MFCLLKCPSLSPSKNRGRFAKLGAVQLKCRLWLPTKVAQSVLFIYYLGGLSIAKQLQNDHTQNMSWKMHYLENLIGSTIYKDSPWSHKGSIFRKQTYRLILKPVDGDNKLIWAGSSSSNKMPDDRKIGQITSARIRTPCYTYYLWVSYVNYSI